jgi:hypothetical protein
MITEPTTWNATWPEGLPVLALPSVAGYEMYQAIRERVAYLFPDAFADEPDTTGMPAELIDMLAPLDPLQDYQTIEWRMHNAVTWMIPYFKNWVAGGGALWNQADLLAQLGETSRLEPVPHFLSAAWIRQMFRIVNYLRPMENIISITWIDEAESGYWPEGELYDQDKADYEDAIDFTTAVIQPVSGNYHIVGPSGAPDNVITMTCGRDDDASVDIFKTAFNLLKSQYSGLDFTVGLFVDASGSMSLDTIQPAYDQFVAWITENYPKAKLVERQAGNERWLVWTREYIAELQFAFQYYEENEEAAA